MGPELVIKYECEPSANAVMRVDRQSVVIVAEIVGMIQLGLQCFYATEFRTFQRNLKLVIKRCFSKTLPDFCLDF